MKHKGFTLIEMIVVLGILGILLSITVPGFMQSVDRSREMEKSKHEEMINTAIRQYYAIELKYPLDGTESSSGDAEILMVKLRKMQSQHYISLQENIYSYKISGKNPPVITVNLK